VKQRSTEKVEVAIDLVAGKPWVVVRDPFTQDWLLVPSFEDLFRIDAAIIHCERASYPDLPWEPGEKVRRFHERSFEIITRQLLVKGWPPPPALYHSLWGRLAAEFKIPIPPDRPGAYRPGEDDPPPPGLAP
jgi:hypothetical protein